MTAYYNEIDPYAAQWLRNLIDGDLIARGDVDERSIVDVRADDLRGYTQAHFFAGIGGWSVALRLAGWPDDRPVWTGSCPCQPFSAAGAGKAADDERHLWPAWFSLIAKCRPPVIFGEQVEAAIGWGWLDAVYADMEAEGYACGAAVLPACSVGAPHIRNRIWFVADAGHDDRPARGAGGEHEGAPSVSEGPTGDRTDSKLAYANGGNASPEGLQRGGQHGQRASDGGALLLADTERDGRRADKPQREAQGRTADGRLDPWRSWDWIECSDGKARPIEPGISPLAHGIQNRMGRLRAYGNAIVPQVAAQFIGASMTHYQALVGTTHD